MAVAALAVLCAAGGEARTASDFFVEAPDSVVRLLPQATRMDMLDYFRYGSDRPSINNLGGDSRILSEKASVMSYQLSSRATMQIAVLPAGRDTVVAVVETLLTPASDSRIKFYDKDWKPVKSPLKMPRRDDWLTEEGRAHADEFALAMPFDLVGAAFDPEGTTLTLTFGASRYLSPSDNERMRGWFRSSMVYDIGGGKFRLRQ